MNLPVCCAVLFRLAQKPSPEVAAIALPTMERFLILDAMTNNPGAAGGAITNWQGELLGVIGNEQKESDSGNWLKLCDSD